MKPRVFVVVAGLVALLAAFVVWRLRGHSADPAATTLTTRNPTTTDPTTNAAITPHADPRTLDRASIEGTITSDAKAPIAGARVCVDGASHDLPNELTRDPKCTETDAAGHYAIGNLFAARYGVVAMAKGFRPDAYYADTDRRISDFVLAGGEHRTGIDIALRGGGVALTGVVSDVTGGTIPRAQVRATTSSWSSDAVAGPMVETDDKGRYTLWVRPGSTDVSAVADGYAQGRKNGNAPGKLDILLTPESSLAGTVIDATSNQPVPGVHVAVDNWDANGDDLTDDRGHFHLTRLNPGRIVLVAKAPRGYGKSDGSILVGLGQHVDGVVLKLWPAQRIVAHVVVGADAQPCARPDATIEDSHGQKWIGFEREPDGTLYADGVLPGTYAPHPGCDGFHADDKYPPVVVVADKEVAPLRWRVNPGATLTGRVLTKSGAPVEDAEITARSVGIAREAMQWTGDRSGKDGAYKLRGLGAGKFKLEITSDVAVGAKDGYPVELAAGATVTQDLILDDGGTIKGVVVDENGVGVADVQLDARSNREGEWRSGNTRADETGSFHIDAVRPGDYRVVATRSWVDELKKPGTTDDAKQGEKVVVQAGQTATVRILVEAQTGTIKGSIVDAEGKPVSDAFVSAARESDAAGAQRSSVQSTRWWGEDKPIVTGTDGTFALTKLSSPGQYTVRAYRKGGGETVAEHVVVGTTAKLAFRPTGSIEGTVTRDGGGFPDELTVAVRDLKNGFQREESFFRTSGHYTVRDLPSGHFLVEAKAHEGHKTTELDLADSEAKPGVDFALVALVTVTGRVVEAGTTNPIPGIMVFATLARSADFSFSMDPDQANVSDASGRFTLKDVPRGQVQIRGFPREWKDSPYAFAAFVKQIDGTGTVDIGDIAASKKRVKPGDPVGELGLHFAEQAPDTAPEAVQLKVSWIDPKGPAVKVDLKVGDIITTVDGTDITGTNAAQGWNLMQAPPGTAMKLGLARGPSVTIVLAAP